MTLDLASETLAGLFQEELSDWERSSMRTKTQMNKTV